MLARGLFARAPVSDPQSQPPKYTTATGQIGALDGATPETRNPAIVLLDLFSSMHDPTTLNRQGSDVGTLYRSAILYHAEEQRSFAEQVITDAVRNLSMASRHLVVRI